MIESTYGKGRVIYLPFDISWSFFRYGHEYLARIMELALRQVAAEPPPVEVEAPTIVEAMPQVQGEPPRRSPAERHLVARPFAERRRRVAATCAAR